MIETTEDRRFCIYATYSKERQQVYIGRSLTENVKKGYQGSGVKITHAVKKYPGAFKTVILIDGLTTDEADYLEADLVTVDLINAMEGKLLNLSPGGRAPGYAARGVDAHIKTKQRLSQVRRQLYIDDPGFKQRQIELLRQCAARKTQYAYEACARRGFILTLDDGQELRFGTRTELIKAARYMRLTVGKLGGFNKAERVFRYKVLSDDGFILNGSKRFCSRSELREYCRDNALQLIKLDSFNYVGIRRAGKGQVKGRIIKAVDINITYHGDEDANS